MPQKWNDPDSLAGEVGVGNRFPEQTAVFNSTNPSAGPATARMQLEDFKPMRRGNLLGFATIRLPNGLQISDIPVCTSGRRAWASLPAKPILDRDGRHLSDENGKKRYVPILQWPDRETADRWSAAVVELVRQHHPEAVDGGER